MGISLIMSGAGRMRPGGITRQRLDSSDAPARGDGRSATRIAVEFYLELRGVHNWSCDSTVRRMRWRRMPFRDGLAALRLYVGLLMSFLDRFRRTEVRSSCHRRITPDGALGAGQRQHAGDGDGNRRSGGGCLSVRQGLRRQLRCPARLRSTRALVPSVLRTIGRELIRRGDCVLAIGVDRETGLSLTPAGTWNVTGGADPTSRGAIRWIMNGPIRDADRSILAAASVLHFRYAVDPARPWAGLGPIGFARHRRHR